MRLVMLSAALLLMPLLSACASYVTANDTAGLCEQPQAPSDPITEQKRAKYMAALWFKVEDCKALLE